MRFVVLVALATIGFLCLLGGPSYAQATRTWVSGVGDDANPCSRTAPCKTFAGAISKTAATGEINVLDPGGFGALTITKSITVRSDHIEAGVLVSGTNGIVVSAGVSDKIVLDGLDFDGIGTGLDGVKVIQAGSVVIRNCAIRNFTQNGVEFNANSGAKGVIEASQILNNAGGVNVAAASGGVNDVFILHSLIDGNSSYAVQVTGISNVAIDHSSLTGKSAAISYAGGTGAVLSTGTNLLRGTGSPNGTITQQ